MNQKDDISDYKYEIKTLHYRKMTDDLVLINT